jgi:hypothetical protein
VALRVSVLTVAVALAAAACETKPLDAGAGTGGMGAAGGTTGQGGTTGFGGDLGGGGGVSGVGGDVSCGARVYSTQPIPPDILILLDASGSMNNDISDTSCGNDGCGATSKWAQMTPAINTVVAETEGSIRWGLKFFADTDATCGVGSGVAVPVGNGNAGAIQNAVLSRTSANGGVSNGSRTPTRTAENAGAAYIIGLTDLSPRFVLLVTDGLPNCTPGSSDTAADDSAGTVAAVTAARTAGIPTMVIGVSTGASPADATLTDVAIAGGYPRAGSPSYYPVSSTAELTAALRALVDMTPNCTFALPPAPVPYTSVDNIGVVVSGTQIPRDTSHTGGWDYTNSAHTAIEIYGPTCDEIKAGTVTSVQILFHCPIG